MHPLSPLNQEFLLNGEARLMNVDIWCANCLVGNIIIACVKSATRTCFDSKREEGVVALPSFTRQKSVETPGWRANLSVIIGFERCVRLIRATASLSLSMNRTKIIPQSICNQTEERAYQFVNVSIPRMESVVPSK